MSWTVFEDEKWDFLQDHFELMNLTHFFFFFLVQELACRSDFSHKIMKKNDDVLSIVITMKQKKEKCRNDSK